MHPLNCKLLERSTFNTYIPDITDVGGLTGTSVQKRLSLERTHLRLYLFHCSTISSSSRLVQHIMFLTFIVSACTFYSAPLWTNFSCMTCSSSSVVRTLRLPFSIKNTTELTKFALYFPHLSPINMVHASHNYLFATAPVRRHGPHVSLRTFSPTVLFLSPWLFSALQVSVLRPSPSSAVWPHWVHNPSCSLSRNSRHSSQSFASPLHMLHVLRCRLELFVLNCSVNCTARTGCFTSQSLLTFHSSTLSGTTSARFPRAATAPGTGTRPTPMRWLWYCICKAVRLHYSSLDLHTPCRWFHSDSQVFCNLVAVSITAQTVSILLVTVSDTAHSISILLIAVSITAHSVCSIYPLAVCIVVRSWASTSSLFASQLTPFAFSSSLFALQLTQLAYTLSLFASMFADFHLPRHCFHYSSLGFHLRGHFWNTARRLPLPVRVTPHPHLCCTSVLSVFALSLPPSNSPSSNPLFLYLCTVFSHLPYSVVLQSSSLKSLMSKTWTLDSPLYRSSPVWLNWLHIHVECSDLHIMSGWNHCISLFTFLIEGSRVVLKMRALSPQLYNS